MCWERIWADLPGMSHDSGYLCFMLWQVNPKMILTLTASIMYWSLQQPVEEMDISPSPATASTITDRSTTSSINGEDESSSLCGEVLNLSLDDTASDTTVSSVIENERDLIWPTRRLISIMMLECFLQQKYINWKNKKANFYAVRSVVNISAQIVDAANPQQNASFW